MPWVNTIAIGLAVSLVLGLLARRIGLSPIVGYLLAGVAVGPHTPGFVGDVALAGQVADLGVILLMFGVGLSFSLQDLLAVRRVALPGALLASGAAVALGATLGVVAGLGTQAAVVFGLCLASASTVVIVRGMLDLGLLSAAPGRIAVGWSVVEDLMVVVVLVLLPALGGASGESSLALDIAFALGRVGLLSALVFGVGPHIVPRLLGLVARVQSRELFTLAVLVLALGTAFVAAQYFGASIALGAFFGGMLVGQSDSSHQAAADALPMRDAFAVIFFMAVGMLFDPRFVFEHPLWIAATLAVVLVGKPAVAILWMISRQQPLRDALAVGAGLAQVSEFSFVLAGLAVSTEIMPAVARDVVLSVVLLSITASPVLFRGARPIERWLLGRGAVARFLARQSAALDGPPDRLQGQLRDHTVLLGYGRVGRVLGQFLDQRKTPYVIVESDRVLAERLRADGLPVIYGDASSPVLLDRAGIAEARVLLVTVPDPVAARLAVEHAHQVNPELHVVARAHHEHERELLHRYPRTRSVHGELELAYAMARLMLAPYGVSAIEAEATVIDARRGHGGPERIATRIVEVHVPASSPAIGLPLGGLALPRGALVITIARGGEFVVPNGATELAEGDALLILADPTTAHAVELAVAPPPPPGA